MHELYMWVSICVCVHELVHVSVVGVCMHELVHVSEHCGCVHVACMSVPCARVCEHPCSNPGTFLTTRTNAADAMSSSERSP